MSLSYAKGAWEARWRDSTGRQRAKRSREEAAARAFDESVGELATGERARRRHGQAGGVHAYPTRSGTRWRYVARRADGDVTSKRGFTGESAARVARRRMVERVERREVIRTHETCRRSQEPPGPRRRRGVPLGGLAAAFALRRLSRLGLR